MIKGFLLDGVYVNRAGISINQAVVFSIPIFTDPAEAPLSSGNNALPRAQLALDAPFFQRHEIGR